jgi:hypothetical protein
MAIEVVPWATVGIAQAYQAFISSLPFWLQKFIDLFLIVIVVVIYSILIWHFYRFIAKKNVFNINLRKYNRSNHPTIQKFFGVLLYLLEYLVILPFLVFLWFSVFTLILVFLTNEPNLQILLMVSATIIVAIRMVAYYKADLAKDLAKFLPFTLLGVFLIQFIQAEAFSFQGVLVNLANIPEFLSLIWVYLLFIIIIEFILRFLEIVFRLTGISWRKENNEAPKVN